MKKTIIAAAFFLFSTVAVIAQPGRPKNDNRRIEQGVRSGSITRSEFDRLKAEEARLKADIYRYKKDRYLSNWERRDLAFKEKQLSENIYRQKHDYQVRH